MLTTLSEIKTYLGVSNSDDDSLLSQLQNIAEDKIEREIGDITSQQRTVQVRLCDFYGTMNGVEYFSKHLNITSLDEINDTAYTGTLGTDYRILDGYKGRKLWIEDLSDYTSGIITPYFNMKYTAGFATIPWDIKELIFKLVQDVYEAEDGKTVKSYKSGPDQTVFADISMEKSLSRFDTILNAYKIHDV